MEAERGNMMIAKAVGPYVPYKEVNGFLYISAQLPLNPETTTIDSDDITLQTNQVLLNLESILKENGGDLSDVINTTVVITDMSEGKAMNLEYIKFFKPPNYPTRTVITSTELMMGAKVQISAIAYINK